MSTTAAAANARQRRPLPRRLFGRHGTALLYVLIALTTTVLAVAAWSQRTRQPLLHNLEGQVIDAQLRARGPIAPQAQPPLAILMVDDRSLAEIGSLPVDRRILAAVVDRLRAEGAAWIVFDMLFAEPARRDPEADATLAAAVRSAGNVVLPYALVSDGPQTKGEPPGYVLASAYTRYRNEALRELVPLRPTRLVAPIADFATQALGLGNVSLRPGQDGSVRYDLPVLWYKDEFYPSLALTVATLVSGSQWGEVDAWLGEAVHFGSHAVPLDLVSRQWVNYYGPAGTFPTYSLADYAAGRLPAGVLRDHVVLIGGSALGSSDRYPSPFDPVLPGVERLATVIDNLLTERWLSRPAWAAPVELAAMLALPLLAVAVIARLRTLLAMVLVLALGASALAAAQALFVSQREFISVAFPLTAMLLASLLGFVLRARVDEASRRAAELQLRASEERYALAARGANDGLWDWDIASGVLFLSERWRQLMDPTADLPARVDGLGAWLERLDQVERERFQQELDAHLAGRTHQFHHVMKVERGGETRWLLARGVAVREDGRPQRMAGSLTDITEQKRLERQIAFDALHDRLTGLANRDLFCDRLRQLLTRREAAEPQPVGLVLADIDGFRAINERYGEVAGNAVLAEVATRMAPLEAEGKLLARLGPDQFAVAYQGPLDSDLPGRVQCCFTAPFAQGEGPETVGATLALAHTAHGLASSDEMLNAATLALAHAKQEGRGGLRLFDPDEQALEHTRRWLDDNLDRALALGGQFMLHYQPFVRLTDRALIGFEALIRWQHPERGLMPPGEFIPHAEQSGHINAIGRWCLHEAARQLAIWDQLGFRGELAVNLSGRQFTETDLEADARTVLGLLGRVRPSRYKLEVTESMAMSNPQRTTEVLQRLAALGFKISIDDFGTGYSSLAYLHRFPFDTLKIDRSFVIRLGSGREAQEIVRTIVELGRALDKQVLAEGVEEEGQAQLLAVLGVHVGQGWLFGRPLPAAAATDLVRRAVATERAGTALMT